MAGRKPYRRYTAKEKAQAVGIAIVDGQTIAQEVTGIPKTTIDYWLNKPEFVPLRTTARAKVIEDLWVGVQVGLDAVIRAFAEDAPIHQKAEAFKVIAERYVLLNGEATARTETRSLTEGLDDHEKQTLADAIDEWLKVGDGTGA